jgi:hypothetical protein
MRKITVALNHDDCFFMEDTCAVVRLGNFLVRIDKRPYGCIYLVCFLISLLQVRSLFYESGAISYYTVKTSGMWFVFLPGNADGLVK